MSIATFFLPVDKTQLVDISAGNFRTSNTRNGVFKACFHMKYDDRDDSVVLKRESVRY